MSGGVPPSSRAGKSSRSKLSQRDDVKKAASLYERFSGHEAEVVGKVRMPKPFTVGVAVGKVAGIMYDTVRDGVAEKYIHKFAKRDAPTLVVSPDGKQLLFIGGRFTFTERGIVDASDKSV